MCDVFLSTVSMIVLLDILHARRDGILYVIVCDEYEGGGVECREAVEVWM